MLTIDDIRYISFRKAGLGGYRTEDVDVFIDGVQASYKELLDKKEEMARQIELLNKQISQYKNEEECIRNTLVSAQRLADVSVSDAKHKADMILREASIRAEKIVSDAQEKILGKQEELNRIKRDVSNFRAKLLETYKEHLKLIDALPAQEQTGAKHYSNEPEVKINTEETVTEQLVLEKKDFIDDIPVIGPISIDEEALKSAESTEN